MAGGSGRAHTQARTEVHTNVNTWAHLVRRAEDPNSPKAIGPNSPNVGSPKTIVIKWVYKLF